MGGWRGRGRGDAFGLLIGSQGHIWFINGGGGIMGRYTTISYQNKNLVNVKSTQSNECIFVLSLDNSGIDSSAITHSL